MVTKLSDREMLRRLGAGEAIEAVVADAGMAAGGFEAWWAAQLALRAPDVSGARVAAVREDVEILRDEWGIPHIVASGDEDLFFGYGYAMAQDRLWQLDYLRRKAMGRLAEVLGSDALPDDVVARTVGINRISRREVTRLPSDTLRRLEAFSSGINMAADESRGRLPIEFDLLGYEPEPWTPLDSVAVWCEFRWYLTGRLAGIAIPELAKRALGDAALYRAFLTTEADDESIVPEGSYPSSQVGSSAPAMAAEASTRVSEATTGSSAGNAQPTVCRSSPATRTSPLAACRAGTRPTCPEARSTWWAPATSACPV